MTLASETSLQKLQFYVTTAYACGYLPNKMAQSLVAIPQDLVDTKAYNNLIEQGFRRSGMFVYRPHCETCNACISVRVILKEFVTNRSQKRAYKQHQNLTANVMPVSFRSEHYDLYAKYQQARHADDIIKAESKTEVDEAEQYRTFLCQSNVESVMVEFRQDHQLKMVSVIDIVRDGISAVYTFYDTDDHKASLGTYNVLWQIEWARSLQLPFLYLGYWIEHSQKMAYKENFQPLQKLLDGEWLPLMPAKIE
jgi:arginine-tRNA-protein transferase